MVIQTPPVLAPALCLDLDGTVRYAKSGKFIQSVDDIALFEGVEKKIWSFRDDGYLIFGISNQGGVAHGFKMPADVLLELKATIDLFDRNPFHNIELCFHDPRGMVEPYNHRSLFRKPSIGLLADCERKSFDAAGYIVDWDNSLFVGDRREDRECAENAGIAFAWAWDFFEREQNNT